MRHLSIVLLCSICLTQTAAAEPAFSYLSALRREAANQKLADDQAWRILLHYRRRLFGVESLGDDPAFFNAADGKHNPQSELNSTLAAFFEPETDKLMHAQCRFPARYYWLNSKLHFDPQLLSPVRCPELEEWLKALDAHGVTLIFPAAYLNNPASMFGHTLLRLDARGQDEKTRLLAYSANYGAITGEDNGVLFAFKGLTGRYQGRFAVDPYYKRVKDYSDLENRDIWEYQLQFSEEETRRLLLHLWELGHTYFDYYFFEENCAYHLLFLLDFARPGLELSDKFPAWVIPADTLRKITANPGLVKSVVYRPSLAAVLEEQRTRLTQAEQESAYLLAGGTGKPDDKEIFELDEDRRAAVFEFSFDYLNYLRLTGEDPEGANDERAREILNARSALPVRASSIKPAEPARPEQGHATARAMIAAGFDDGRMFYEVSARPSYHDLYDDQAGYPPGSQIEFFSLALRQEEGQELKLERLLPVSILSLAPRNMFVKPVSWQINSGVERLHLKDDDSYYVINLQGGPGAAWSVGKERMFAGFGLLRLQHRPGEKDSDALFLGVGPALTATAEVSGWLRVGGEFQLFAYPGQDSEEDLRVSFTQRASLNANTALGLSAARICDLGFWRSEFMFSFFRYF